MEDNKPKSIRNIRKLKKKSNRISESFKRTIFIRGNKTSNNVINFLKDIRSFRKQKSIMYGRKHQIHPFQSRNQIEKFCAKAQASLFLFGSHNKKRPDNIVLGRTYQNKILDMVQLGIKNYTSVADFQDSPDAGVHVHPFIIFQGDLWETDQSFKKLRNLFNDFFYMNEKLKGVQIDKIMNVLVCISALQDKRIFMKTYKVQMSGKNILQEDGKMTVQDLGPHVEFVLRRTSFADTQILKQATFVPKPVKKKQNKNVKYDGLGNKRGKLYVDHQNFNNMPTKRKFIQKQTGTKKVEENVGLKERFQNEFGH